jgi:hypothetical protein
MSPKILLRCDLCGKFHASYLVENAQLGQLRLCYSCWHANYTPQAPVAATTEQAAADAETNPLRRKQKKEKINPG